MAMKRTKLPGLWKVSSGDVRYLIRLIRERLEKDGLSVEDYERANQWLDELEYSE